MPLLFDMSLDKLPSYQGTNPRPSDFDEYWDAGLAELAATDPDVELVPADFQAPYAECSHLYFTGTRGARVHAKLLRPRDAQEPHPAVLMFHGYSGNAGDWQSKLGFVAAGFTVAACGAEGKASFVEDLLYRHTFLDTARLAQIVMEMDDVDADRVGATGGSQGGGLTLACVSLEPRVKRAAPIFPFLCDYKRVWDLDMDQNAYAELREWFRNFDPRHDPGRSADGCRSHGPGLPAVYPVRRLQQDRLTQTDRHLPRLRPRKTARLRRHDLSVDARNVGAEG